MATLKRRRLAYDPDFSTDVAGWAINHIKANYWRFAGFHEFEDLVQEARFQFWRLCLKYPLVRDRPHMVRLFQRTFSTRLHDLARHCGKLRRCQSWEVDTSDDGAEVDQRFAVPEPVENDAGTRLLPQELVVLIQECHGDLALLSRHLSVPARRVRQSLRTMPSKLRASVMTTNPNRVYICEE